MCCCQLIYLANSIPKLGLGIMKIRIIPARRLYKRPRHDGHEVNRGQTSTRSNPEPLWVIRKGEIIF